MRSTKCSREQRRVVIVVGPAEAELVLARLLNLRGAIARLPEAALLGKDRVAREVASDDADDLVEDRMSLAKAFGVVREMTASQTPQFGRLQQSFDLA